MALASCASYQPLVDLPGKSNLANGLAQLNLSLPQREAGGAPARINPRRPLSPDQVGLLAIVNNPDFKGEREKVGLAEAEALAASLLPNPSVNLGYAFLLGGPGTADAITASISQDIQSLITYGPKVAAADARLHQVR
ncbi:MAG TPA: TolC family protein, partial [Beijerinckiaceae bacterium]|nr:TolC family protein [Beijerinckiaceae bacterium]